MASSVHFFFNWAKERMDEMDAILSSLEGKANQLSAESGAAAEKIVAELRSKRDSFFNDMKKQGEASEAAWLQVKAKLEAEWNAFQSEAKKYFEGVSQQAKQQQMTFEEVAAAQLKAWREAADKMQVASAEFATDGRVKIEAALQQMKAEAAAAEANLQKLGKAGNESWSALSSALAESRAAFDRANQAAWDAFKRFGQAQP